MASRVEVPNYKEALGGRAKAHVEGHLPDLAATHPAAQAHYAEQLAAQERSAMRQLDRQFNPGMGHVRSAMNALEHDTPIVSGMWKSGQRMKSAVGSTFKTAGTLALLGVGGAVALSWLSGMGGKGGKGKKSAQAAGMEEALDSAPASCPPPSLAMPPQDMSYCSVQTQPQGFAPDGTPYYGDFSKDALGLGDRKPASGATKTAGETSCQMAP